MFHPAKRSNHRAARRGQRGFTLIELLVVITIIGILAAVAIPQLAPELDKARRNAARGEAMQLYVAFQRYLDATGAYPATVDVENYSELRTAIGNQLSLPSSSADANFTLVSYTDSNASTPKNFSLIIQARDSALTQFTITRNGVGG